MTTELCYSADEESFNYDDFGDFIDSIAPEVGQTYWEADKEQIDAIFPINGYTVSSLLENFDERMYDEIGEVYDNECSDVSDEAKEELDALLKAWATKHLGAITRYWIIVGKVREKQFTAEDLA